MRARCPVDPDHAEFVTTAHVMQEWRVTRDGSFLEEVNPCLEVTHDPNPDNTWTCATCGATAEVER